MVEVSARCRHAPCGARRAPSLRCWPHENLCSWEGLLPALAGIEPATPGPALWGKLAYRPT
jgi:hypothetical protein